ncbi:hypothetical protein BE221DRAFT_189654 [Ostreococcus tauri]|uniref:starch synthase n=1 Tax=Ostreococcus tauri TaxID=70448 RepID=A0A1Y5IN33_OSTTA|nr:hypothetical protein BE221DRAFT_189654 [Ostreococcus tauri]
MPRACATMARTTAARARTTDASRRWRRTRARDGRAAASGQETDRVDGTRERVRTMRERAMARAETVVDDDDAAMDDALAIVDADDAREALLREELRSLQIELAATREERERDAEDAARASAVAETLTIELDAATKEFERLTVELDSATARTGQIEIGAAESRERLTRALEVAETEVERLTAALEKSEANADDVGAKLAETREQLSQAREVAEQDVERLQAELEKAKEAMSALASSAEDNSRLQSDFDCATAEIARLELALEKSEANADDVGAKLAETREQLSQAREVAEQEVELLQIQLNAAKRKAEEAASTIDDMREQLDDVIEAGEKEITSLQIELNAASKVADEAGIKLADMSEQLLQANEVAGKEVERLRAELEKTKEEQNNESNGVVLKLEGKLDTVKAAMESLEAELNETKLHLNDMTHKRDAAVLGRDSAVEESKKLLELLVTAKRELEVAAIEQQNLRSEVNQGSGTEQSDIQLFEQLVAAQKEEINTLRELLEASTLTTRALEEQLVDLSKEKDAALAELSSSDAVAASETDRIQKLIQERDAALSELADSSESRVFNEERIQKLIEERDDALQKLVAMERQATQTAASSSVPQIEGVSTEVPAVVVSDSAVTAHGDKVRERVRRQLEEAIKGEAIRFVDERERKKKTIVTDQMTKTKDGVYYFIGDVKSSQRARIIYNRHTLSKMSRDGQVFIHVGFDGWTLGVPKKIGMIPLAVDAKERNVDHRVRDQGDWVVGEFDVQEGASSIDFVFSDANDVYDNNSRKDYQCAVEQDQQRSHEDLIVEQIETDLASKRDFIEKCAQRAGERAESHERRRSRSLLAKTRDGSLNRVHTIPHQPEAGENVTIYYRVEGSALANSQKVHCQGSWNRWNHENSFGPSIMQFSDSLGCMQLTVKAPQDAHVLDLKFMDSDVPSEVSQVDDNNGMDYHTVIVNGSGPAPILKVVHVAVEMAPIAKVGGMGDVVTALARATQEDGHQVEVFVPHYDIAQFENVDGYHRAGEFKHEKTVVQVYKGWVEDVPVTLLRPENGFFDVGCIYGRGDDHVRFDFFTDATLTWLRSKQQEVDVIHTHDWQTAAATWAGYPNAATALTVHNLQFGVDRIRRGMESCDIATTVSPTYADEVRFHHAIAPSKDKFIGIRNGIDTDIWNPANDKFLPVGYNRSNAIDGKRAAAAELCNRLGLEHPEGSPIVGVVSRLTAQKGIHLIKHACYRVLERGATFVLLGNAPDPAHQHDFNSLAKEMKEKYPGRSGFMFKYDEPLSHLIYAGCDFLLVPSMFEPCGLTQMIAMRYGTVPVVRRTGGLADTVFDVENDSTRCATAGIPPNGFVFDGTETRDIDSAVIRALDAFYDRERWESLALVDRAMSCDWGWFEPSKRYEDLYWSALSKKRNTR